MLRAIVHVGCIIVAWAFMMPPAAAAGRSADDEQRFEITPLVGYRNGGEFDAVEGTTTPDAEDDLSFGVALSMAAPENGRYELLFSSQPTKVEGTGADLNIMHLHVGGNLTYDESENFIPFIALGVGGTRFEPEHGDAETRFSASMGLGFALPINDRLRVRFEVRGYVVAMDGDSKLFCRSNAAGGQCLVRAAGDTFFQSEVLIGVAFGLGGSR